MRIEQQQQKDSETHLWAALHHGFGHDLHGVDVSVDAKREAVLLLAVELARWARDALVEALFLQVLRQLLERLLLHFRTDLKTTANKIQRLTHEAQNTSVISTVADTQHWVKDWPRPIFVSFWMTGIHPVLIAAAPLCNDAVDNARRAHRTAADAGAMHAPLDRPHPDCQEVIMALNLCHEENPRMKFFGACNEAKVALDKCFKKEKERKRDENLRRARASDAYVRQKMKERREREAQAAQDAK